MLLCIIIHITHLLSVRLVMFTPFDGENVSNMSLHAHPKVSWSKFHFPAHGVSVTIFNRDSSVLRVDVERTLETCSRTGRRGHSEQL